MRAMRRTTIAAALGVCGWLAPIEQGAAAPGSEASAGAEPAAGSQAPAPPTGNPTFTQQEQYTTPRPTQPPPAPEQRWKIRQAPLAGAEASWGPPGSQMPEYAELEGPEPAPKGPPPKGTGRIVTGAILGPAGLALTIAGIVGATTAMLGDNRRLSVPMIGVGLVSTALGTGLLVDGILRRQRFFKWQARGVSLVPVAAPGRFAGAMVGWRF
jgi:hypothetical protein